MEQFFFLPAGPCDPGAPAKVDVQRRKGINIGGGEGGGGEYLDQDLGLKRTEKNPFPPPPLGSHLSAEFVRLSNKKKKD